MKKITALILAIILCFTLAIPALGSEMSVNGQAYSINGIDVYKYPLKASQYFSVETIIYFVSDAAFAQVPVNDDVGVYLVTTMEEVTALASANPYLISICGYTVFTNNLGYYTAVTSTTFVDLNFDCGYTGGYRVVTEIDWS